MSVGFRLAYRFGITPWEKSGAALGPQLESLLDREQEQAGEPLGTALDIGCGTGDHAIELARRGWRVTGLDYVDKAIESAREKATAKGIDVNFVQGDATRLTDSVGSAYQLVLDVGCLHGFKPAAREAYARGVTSVTAPGGALLLFAFGPGRRGPVPAGISRSELLERFDGWELTHQEAADTDAMPSMLKKSEPQWYRLVRSS